MKISYRLRGEEAEKELESTQEEITALLNPGVTISAGGYLYLGSLTTLSEGVTISVGGNLYLGSLITLPEGVTIWTGGGLYLGSLTTLPEGVTLSAGGNLYLGRLTTLPEGVTISAGGGLYLSVVINTTAPLKPWREEMAECERVFSESDPQIGDWCAWLHREITFERLMEPWENRFDYIASQKPQGERAWRFRNMRPLPKPVNLAEILRKELSGKAL